MFGVGVGVGVEAEIENEFEFEMKAGLGLVSVVVAVVLVVVPMMLWPVVVERTDSTSLEGLCTAPRVRGSSRDRVGP